MGELAIGGLFLQVKVLASKLDQITDLARSNPFRELVDLATVKAALNDPDHIWEL